MNSRGWDPHDRISVFSFNFIYLLFKFLALLRLCCYVWAFSSLGEWGLLLFRSMGSAAVGHGLSCLMASSWTRDGTRVPCIAGRILNHGKTSEAPGLELL